MKFRPRIRYRHQVRSTSGVSYLPTQLAAFYGLGSKTAGAGKNIAVVELGGAFSQKDLDAYFKSLGLSVKPVVFHSVQGAQNTSDPDADAEVMLDLCVAGGVAPGAQLHCYAAPNTDAGFLAAVNQAVTDKVDAHGTAPGFLRRVHEVAASRNDSTLARSKTWSSSERRCVSASTQKGPSATSATRSSCPATFPGDNPPAYPQ